MKTNMRKKGFTLVEILIVVVILGILAAIVIPQFSEASSQARNSSVQSNLQMVRSQIELYKIQHNDVLPGLGAGGASFYECMTDQTDITGSTSGTDDYGPYMKIFPQNALNDKGNALLGAEITVVATGTRAEAPTFGWAYDTTDGDFYACDDFDVEGDSDEATDSWNW